jgi:hypothetical protein
VPAPGVADGQAGFAATAEGPPEGADGDGREVKLEGDLGQGLAVEVAADDLLAGGERDGAGHGRSSGFLEKGDPRILRMALPWGYNFLSRPGV